MENAMSWTQTLLHKYLYEINPYIWGNMILGSVNYSLLYVLFIFDQSTIPSAWNLSLL
jgi:hypothetical protein